MMRLKVGNCNSVVLLLALFVGSGLSMEDLVHFVKDLLELEEEKKKAKDPNNKKGIHSLSPKSGPESRTGNSSKNVCD